MPDDELGTGTTASDIGTLVRRVFTIRFCAVVLTVWATTAAVGQAARANNNDELFFSMWAVLASILSVAAIRGLHRVGETDLVPLTVMIGVVTGLRPVLPDDPFWWGLIVATSVSVAVAEFVAGIMRFASRGRPRRTTAPSH